MKNEPFHVKFVRFVGESTSLSTLVRCEVTERFEGILLRYLQYELPDVDPESVGCLYDDHDFDPKTETPASLGMADGATVIIAVPGEEYE